MKRIVSALLFSAMMVNLLTGCTSPAPAASSTAGSASPSTSASASTPASTPAAGNVNEFGWEVPEKTLVIKAMNAIGNYAPMEAEKQGAVNTQKYLKEKLNIDLQMENITGDGKEALNLALAANNYPDIIMGVTYDMVQKFVDQKKVYEMTPVMDTIGKDLKETMGDMYPLFLTDDMKIYAVPYLMGSIDELPDNSAHIRYDEWQAIGAPEIKSPDDYYNALNAILEKFPTTPTGEKRYAMSLYTEPNGITDPVDLCGFWGLQKGWKMGDAGALTYWTSTEEGKEMSRFLNRFHRDGTLDPDSFINNFEQWKTKFSNERIVGALGGWWITSNAGHEVWQSIDPNTPEEKRYIQVSFKDSKAEAAYLSGKNKFGSRYTIITDKAKQPEELMKFINFQATERGRALTTWGIPNGTAIGDTGKTGKFWNLDASGSWSVDPEAKQQLITETWSYDNEYHWTTGMPWFFTSQDRWPDGVHNMWPNQMWYEENKWKSMMIKNMEGTIYDYSPMVLREVDAEVAKLEQAIKDARLANWPAVVQAKDDAAFDAAWTKLQNAMAAAGVERYTEIRVENYKKNLAKIDAAK